MSRPPNKRARSVVLPPTSLFTWDQTVFRNFWLLREYLPDATAMSDAQAVPIGELADLLDGADVQSIPVSTWTASMSVTVCSSATSNWPTDFGTRQE